MTKHHSFVRGRNSCEQKQRIWWFMSYLSKCRWKIQICHNWNYSKWTFDWTKIRYRGLFCSYNTKIFYIIANELREMKITESSVKYKWYSGKTIKALGKVFFNVDIKLYFAISPRQFYFCYVSLTSRNQIYWEETGYRIYS